MSASPRVIGSINFGKSSNGYVASASPMTQIVPLAAAIPPFSAAPYPRTGTSTTRAPAARASSAEPSVEPLSATTTSPSMSFAANVSSTCRTTRATDPASFRQGRTTLTAGGSIREAGLSSPSVPSWIGGMRSITQSA